MNDWDCVFDLLLLIPHGWHTLNGRTEYIIPMLCPRHIDIYSRLTNENQHYSSDIVYMNAALYFIYNNYLIVVYGNCIQITNPNVMEQPICIYDHIPLPPDLAKYLWKLRARAIACIRPCYYPTYEYCSY